jgi:hypothetical protein
MLLTTSLPAAAQAGLTFNFINMSGYQVHGLYVDASSSATWGENILSRPLEFDGDAVTVTFSGYGDTCVFDIAAQFSDGSYQYNTQFNLCSITNVTLNPENIWSWE